VLNKINLIKTKRFLPLFITQFCGAFNDNAFKNAFLIWFTYDLAVKISLNPQIIVTVSAGLFILPFFLFSSIAGQFADKFEKSALIVKIKQVEIILMILAFLGFYLENLSLLLIILFLMGMQSAFFGPLKYSLLPLHLKEDELITGNGLIEGGTFISILLGTIIGGLLIRTQYGVELRFLSLLFYFLSLAMLQAVLSPNLKQIIVI
jgi:acyl-[acyl-carrier-protein]-phospholipid O-acyltransferase/long-chain-fatty-acid--[acyl-carrier-protein] ligase